MHREGWTALHYAVSHGHLPSFDALINAGASLNIQTNEYFGGRWAFGGRHGLCAVGVGQCCRLCCRCPQGHAAALCCPQWQRRRNGRADRRRRGRVHQGLDRVRRAAPHSRAPQPQPWCPQEDGRATSPILWEDRRIRGGGAAGARPLRSPFAPPRRMGCTERLYRDRACPCDSWLGLCPSLPLSAGTGLPPLATCAGTGQTPGTSAPGLCSRDPATSVLDLGSPLPHLHRDWAHPCCIRTRTVLTPATSAPGLLKLGSLLPSYARGLFTDANVCHIRTGMGFYLPRLCRGWAHPWHVAPEIVSSGIGLSFATSAPGLRGTSAPELVSIPLHLNLFGHICTGTVFGPATSVPAAGPAPATSAPGLRSLLARLHRDMAHLCRPPAS